MSQTTQIKGGFTSDALSVINAAQSEVAGSGDISAHTKIGRIDGIPVAKIALRKITSAAGKPLWVPAVKTASANLGSGSMEWPIDVLQSAAGVAEDVTEKTIEVALFRSIMKLRDESRGTDSTKAASKLHNEKHAALVATKAVEKINGNPVVPCWLAI